MLLYFADWHEILDLLRAYVYAIFILNFIKLQFLCKFINFLSFGEEQEESDTESRQGSMPQRETRAAFNQEANYVQPRSPTLQCMCKVLFLVLYYLVLNCS